MHSNARRTASDNFLLGFVGYERLWRINTDLVVGGFFLFFSTDSTEPPTIPMSVRISTRVSKSRRASAIDEEIYHYIYVVVAVNFSSLGLGARQDGQFHGV